MPDRFAKITPSMGLIPKQRKICQTSKAVVKLETIGNSLTVVSLIVIDQDLADQRKDGGACVTYWESEWMAEKVYDLHLTWIKSLPLGG